MHLSVVSLRGILPKGVLTARPLQEVYVNQLKEDKLRALGVDEQIPRTSPALSVMSRQGSSQSSALLTSPPLASSAHVGPFPSSFYGAANPASYIGKPGVSHFPRYSMAHTSNEPSLVSPSQFCQPSEPHIPGTWSPQTYRTSQQGSRVASPGINGHVQTFGQVAPSVSPIGISNAGQISNQASIDMLARMREHQALLQLQQFQQQQQHHLQQQVLQERSLPSLGKSQNGEQILPPVSHHNQAGIATPIPRSHRQNPSENLQKGFDRAEVHVPYSMGENEGREGSKAAQNDEGYDEFQAKITPGNVEGAAPQNAAANGSVLDANLSVSAHPNHETNQPGQSQSKYSKPSQLNVNAPKFEPRNLKNSDVFSFLGNQQARKVIEKESPNFPSSDGVIQAPNGACQPSKLNVAAPPFMPKASVMATVPSREFSFSALRPSFRPDAPAFRPSDSAKASGPGPASEQNAMNKIFGDINFPEVIKPSKSKAIPITKPSEEFESKEKSHEDVDGQEDESGRITQADGRQKRIRYVNSGIALYTRDFRLSRKTCFGGRARVFNSRCATWTCLPA